MNTLSIDLQFLLASQMVHHNIDHTVPIVKLRDSSLNHFQRLYVSVGATLDESLSVEEIAEDFVLIMGVKYSMSIRDAFNRYVWRDDLPVWMIRLSQDPLVVWDMKDHIIQALGTSWQDTDYHFPEQFKVMFIKNPEK